MSEAKQIKITGKDGVTVVHDIGGGGGGAPYFEDDGKHIYFYNADTNATYIMYHNHNNTTYSAIFTHNGTTWVLGENTECGSMNYGSYVYWSVGEGCFGIEYWEVDSYGSTSEGTVSNIYCVSNTNDITTYNCTWSKNLHACFAEGTLITLADGTTKAIEDITYDDELLTWNFDGGRLGANKPCWIAKEATAPCYWRVELEDGIVLKLVGANGKCHRLYNHTQRKFVYPQDFAPTDVTMSANGFVRIKSCEKVNEEVKYYNLMTNHDINCFAEWVLTGNRFCNIYPIDWDMTYIKDDRELVSRETYAEIPDKIFYGLRLAEQPIQDDCEDNVNYFHTMKEHILHNIVEHEKDYTGPADYETWIFKKKENK